MAELAGEEKGENVKKFEGKREKKGKNSGILKLQAVLPLCGVGWQRKKLPLINDVTITKLEASYSKGGRRVTHSLSLSTLPDGPSHWHWLVFLSVPFLALSIQASNFPPFLLNSSRDSE